MEKLQQNCYKKTEGDKQCNANIPSVATTDMIAVLPPFIFYLFSFPSDRSEVLNRSAEQAHHTSILSLEFLHISPKAY